MYLSLTEWVGTVDALGLQVGHQAPLAAMGVISPQSYYSK